MAILLFFSIWHFASFGKILQNFPTSSNSSPPTGPTQSLWCCFLSIVYSHDHCLFNV